MKSKITSLAFLAAFLAAFGQFAVEKGKFAFIINNAN